MVNKVPEWIATVTQVEFVIDEKAFITIASHALDFEGTFLSRHPSSGQVSDAKIVARIKLGKVLGSGSLWDVYQAKMYLSTTEDPDEESVDVMVKYTSCMDFNGDRYFGGDATHILDTDSALDAVKNDHVFYTKHLSMLQGEMIPLHYGTFIEPDLLVCCMILEDVGSPIGRTTSLALIQPEDKETIIAIYKKLHSNKILHNGVDRWYVYQNDAGDIRIIDFHRSTIKFKPGLWFEWEELKLKVNCCLAKYITFAKFKEGYDKKSHQATRKKSEADQEAESLPPAKRPRRQPKYYGRN